MVYGTYNYSIHGVYKPYNWGAPPCRDGIFVELGKLMNIPICSMVLVYVPTHAWAIYGLKWW